MDDIVIGKGAVVRQDESPETKSLTGRATTNLSLNLELQATHRVRRLDREEELWEKFSCVLYAHQWLDDDVHSAPDLDLALALALTRVRIALARWWRRT